MLTGKQISDLEQAATMLAKQYIPIYAEQLRAYVENGFTRAEGLQMVRDFQQIMWARAFAGSKSSGDQNS